MWKQLSKDYTELEKLPEKGVGGRKLGEYYQACTLNNYSMCPDKLKVQDFDIH